MGSKSHGYGVRESRLRCQRVTVMGSESKGHGVIKSGRAGQHWMAGISVTTV
jgi:hypothetical protein